MAGRPQVNLRARPFLADYLKLLDRKSISPWRSSALTWAPQRTILSTSFSHWPRVSFWPVIISWPWQPTHAALALGGNAGLGSCGHSGAAAAEAATSTRT